MRDLFSKDLFREISSMAFPKKFFSRLLKRFSFVLLALSFCEYRSCKMDLICNVSVFFFWWSRYAERIACSSFSSILSKIKSIKSLISSSGFPEAEGIKGNRKRLFSTSKNISSFFNPKISGERRYSSICNKVL